MVTTGLVQRSLIAIDVVRRLEERIDDSTARSGQKDAVGNGSGGEEVEEEKIEENPGAGGGGEMKVAAVTAAVEAAAAAAVVAADHQKEGEDWLSGCPFAATHPSSPCHATMACESMHSARCLQIAVDYCDQMGRVDPAIPPGAHVDPACALLSAHREDEARAAAVANAAAEAEEKDNGQAALAAAAEAGKVAVGAVGAAGRRGGTFGEGMVTDDAEAMQPMACAPPGFGPYQTAPIEPFEAEAVLPVADAHGCQPIDPAVAHGRVVVVERGGCMFEEKVLNAERAGAVGVIVSLVEEGPIFVMAGLQADPPKPPAEVARELSAKKNWHAALSSSSSDAGDDDDETDSKSRTRIPAVMVSKADGERLKRLVRHYQEAAAAAAAAATPMGGVVEDDVNGMSGLRVMIQNRKVAVPWHLSTQQQRQQQERQRRQQHKHKHHPGSAPNQSQAAGKGHGGAIPGLEEDAAGGGGPATTAAAALAALDGRVLTRMHALKSDSGVIAFGLNGWGLQVQAVAERWQLGIVQHETDAKAVDAQAAGSNT